jgi:hypothetical protein
VKGEFRRQKTEDRRQEEGGTECQRAGEKQKVQGSRSKAETKEQD